MACGRRPRQRHVSKRQKKKKARAATYAEDEEELDEHGAEGQDPGHEDSGATGGDSDKQVRNEGM